MARDAQVTLATSKTEIAPIKRLTIPRLELCGAYILAQLLHHELVGWHIQEYVGYRVSCIADLIVGTMSMEQRILATALPDHDLWWNDPEWLKLHILAFTSTS